MAGIMSKIRSLFSRKGKENTGDSSHRDGPAEKRMRYVSTPALLFTPKQIATKRLRRSCYLIREVVNTTEDRNYEFKLGGMMKCPNTLRVFICKYASAFFNAEGGVLIGGIRDDGEVIGVTLDSWKMDEVANILREEMKKFRPIVESNMTSLKFVPVSRHMKEDFVKNLFVIEIYFNKGKPNKIYETGFHEVFVRRDGGVQGPLRPLAIKDLVIEKYKMVLQDRKNSATELEETLPTESRKAGPGTVSQNELKPVSTTNVRREQDPDSSLEIIAVKTGNPGAQRDQPLPRKIIRPVKIIRNVDRTTSQATERTTSQATERTTSQSTERTTSQATERTTSQAAGRTTSQATERTTSQSTERTTSQSRIFH